MAFRALNSCSRVPSKVGRAYYSNTASSGFVKPVFIDVPRPTLAEYRNGVPASNGAKTTTRAAKVTTLANGLKVASLTSSDIGVSLGLFVGVGARNETRSNTGATHFLKFSAFQSSTEKAGYQVVRELEATSASFNATVAREHLAFTAEIPPSQVDNVVPILSSMLSPRLQFHEIQNQSNSVREDSERLQADPIASLFELVHRQAYRNKGLGQSLIATEDNIHHLNESALAKFVDAHYTPDQSVFVGVGLEHDVLVSTVEAAFANKTSKKQERSTEASKYVGGEFLLPSGGHTHLALAFEGASFKGDSKDILALGVLKHILGTVLNANAGTNIGSGISARLATNVLPNNNAAYVLSAFNFSYSDSGLFGVYAETRDAPSRLVNGIASELAKLRSNISAEELAKGKSAFKLTVLDQGSLRIPALEFIGTQVLASGKAVTPEEYAAQIDSLTAEDVARVAKKVFSSRPTFVAVGDVSQLPTAEEIASAVNSK